MDDIIWKSWYDETIQRHVSCVHVNVFVLYNLAVPGENTSSWVFVSKKEVLRKLVTTSKLIITIKTAIGKVTEAHNKESVLGEINTHSAFWKQVDKEETEGNLLNEFEWMAKQGQR